MNSEPRAWRTLAQALSWIFHPFVISAPTLWYAAYAMTHDAVASMQWTAFFIVIVIIPAIIFIALRVRNGQYTDADVSVRQHRFSVYFFGGGCFVLGLILFIHLGAPRILVASLLAALVALALGMLVTTRTKASAHAGVTAGCAAVLFFVSVPFSVLVIFAALTVGWARIYLHQHTPTQVILGWVIALVSVAIVFPFFLPLPFS
jgi:membrane-associated phospholipid phosphatase